MELINEITTLLQENETKKRQKKEIEEKIAKINQEIDTKEKELEISQNALNLLRNTSEKTVSKSYKFLEKTINEALERIFKDRKREIKIVETVRSNQYPQVELELTTENGVIELKNDGRGISQIISFLISICLIILSGARKFVAIDEVLDGLSVDTLKIMDDIIKDFTSIGFVFIINQHNYVPSNAKVYELEMKDGVTGIKDVYYNENMRCTVEESVKS